MTDTTDPTARFEAFFRKRSENPDDVRVVGHELITGGYSRLMTRVWVEEGGERKGYIVRQDPPPGQAIIETDRATEWDVLSDTAPHGQGPDAGPAVVRPHR